MTLFRTSGPDAEPVSAAELKAHLRLDHDSEDTLIEGLLRAAREETEAQTGMALLDQTWRLALDRWPPHGLARLWRHPVKEIIAVTVYGADGEALLVDPATMELDPHARPARLYLSHRPVPGRRFNGIEIDFRAGHGEAGTDVPDQLRRAILVLAAHWYEFRAAFGPKDQPVSIPPAFERIIASYRTGRL